MYSIILGTKNSQIHFSFARWGVSLLAILLISSSCSLFGDNLIAECNDNHLTESDYLSYIDAFNLVNDESTREKFIEEWVMGCLVNQEVKVVNEQIFVRNSIRSEQFLVDKNLFELENIYIDNNLDTLVTDQQIMVHYRNNRSNYIRKSFIVKALYLKLPDSIAENDIIETSFLLKNDKERDNIDKYGNIYGLTYYWEEDKWIFLDDLIREIPITSSVKENIVVKKGEGIFKDDIYRYYLNVFDYRVKESKEPLTFERNEIRNHILKRRINALREEANNKIIEELNEKYSYTIN